MIGRLSGQLAYRATDHVMIDVGGVGYLVYCSSRTLASLPAMGGFVSLYTDLLVREDLLQLFGFESMAEKEWYRLLCTVQGVGAKAALAILGALGTEGVSRAIALADTNSVKAAPGVGPKLALRVVMELKDKAPAVMAMAGQGAQPARTAAAPDPAAPAGAVIEPAPPPANVAAQADALSALANLGYAPADAATAVMQAAAAAPDQPTPALIRAALRLLAPKE